jgi:hypothetical protein
MKLRAFSAGPFQWRIRSGRWTFQFGLAGLLFGGGTTGVVPTKADFPLSYSLLVTAAGPLFTLLSGILALSTASAVPPNSPVQAGGRLAEFGALSLAICAFNLIPFRTGDYYSDGARMYQMLTRGPWNDYHRAIAVVASSLVTPLRPRNFDIDALQRASRAIAQGKEAVLLRLYAYMYFFDQGNLAEAGRSLKDAECIYHSSASDLPAELCTEFVFANAYVLRDPIAAREWWTRMEGKKPTGRNEDYWKASSALHWIEGDLKSANEDWEKCNTLVQQLPRTGAYEFDRHCSLLLRKVIDEAPVSSNYNQCAR